MTLRQSWVESANKADTPFPLNNLPYGVFSVGDGVRSCGVAIGDRIVNLRALEDAGVVRFDGAFSQGCWNAFMAQGPEKWSALRARLTQLLAKESTEHAQVEPCLVDRAAATLHMPFAVSEYTDFYASRHHATNVGTMFRGAQNALPPNWLHIPIGYNGRASSVVVSGTDVRRPWGQIKGPDDALPRFAPSARFDMELELGAIVGTASTGPVTVQEADAHIFGYVLLNDWSARDIQAWEYQPLGPFQSKATATTISPWIVTTAALDPFRCPTPRRAVDLLPHLKDAGPMLFDIDLEVTLAPEGGLATTITRTNYKEMYYSAAQQLAHHTTSGCAMRVGDLLGSGTVSGPEKENRGSLLELSWGGQEPVALKTGETRCFIEDGDTVTITGAAVGNGYKIGFGLCRGRLLPALADPYARDG
jgi:fumarylacetoacetase